MDRVIEVKVGGNYLSKDSKNAGVRGEANVAYLRITFDEGWDSYTKKVTFWDSRGGNPVVRTLTIDLLENISKSKRIYLVPIPAEPMAEAGMLTYVIDGYIDGKRQRSISDQLEVKDAPIADNAGEPTDPTPTQSEQLQVQIDVIKGTIQNAVIAEQNAKTSENNAKTSEENARKSAVSALSSLNKAKEYAEEAGEHSARAENFVEDANEAANKAELALTHNPVIVDGYWHIWSAKHKEYINTNVKAQSGSVVYIGDNPPADADVWIDPDGESALYAPYIGANGNWYTFNPETQTFTDSGHKAVAKDGDKGDKGDTGEQGVKGDSYILTDEDKAEIGDNVSAEIEAELNAALDAIIAIQEELLIPDGNGVAY